MNEKVVKQYCRRVGRKLVCRPQTKKLLLHGLMDELAELSGEDTVSLSCLEEKLGTVAETAAALQDSVPEEEYRRAVEHQKQRMLIILLLAVALAMAVVCFTLSRYMNILHYQLYPPRG